MASQKNNKGKNRLSELNEIWKDMKDEITSVRSRYIR